MGFILLMHAYEIHIIHVEKGSFSMDIPEGYLGVSLLNIFPSGEIAKSIHNQIIYAIRLRPLNVLPKNT